MACMVGVVCDIRTRVNGLAHVQHPHIACFFLVMMCAPLIETLACGHGARRLEAEAGGFAAQPAQLMPEDWQRGAVVPA
jgi:hypothetical protein